jgi:hypothetical protein
MPAVTREAIDRAAIDGVSLFDVPGPHARPSVLVPRDEMALALRLHLSTFEKHAAPLFATGKMSETAFRGVASQVCRALDEGPLSSVEIRRSITHPDAAELLPGALAGLAVRGIVRRFPVDGRIDSPKYLYELRHPDDRPDLDSEGDAAAVVAKSAALFLRRHGPATLDELTWWGGLTKSAVRRALAALGAEPVDVPGWTGRTREAWLLPEDLAAWRSFTPDEAEQVVLLPYRDPFVHLRRGPASLATTDHAPVLDGALRRARLGDVESLSHHAIVSRGELVGIWEYDPEAEAVLTRLWHSDAALRRRVAKAAAGTERFIREQLGDAKLSAVDPPAKRARRIAFCRVK